MKPARETVPFFPKHRIGRQHAPTRAQEFAETWNGGDAARVASTFAEDSVTHVSVGPEPLGASFVGRPEIERGVAAFFARFPGGRFETLRVIVAGDLGSFEWDFGTAGCDLLRLGR